MLEAVDLAFGYPGRRVGGSVGLTLAEGEVTCLLGPNGSGKTTLIRTLLGFLPPQAGEVRLDGQPLRHWSDRERARRLAWVPQSVGLFFPYTARETVLMGRAARLGLFAQPGPADEEVALRSLKALGVEALAPRPLPELSGGERQLVLLARALAQEPRVLLMDEPTASLDLGNQMLVLGRIRVLAEAGLAVLFTTHQPDHAFLCADRVLLLHGGQLTASGPPAEVLTTERLSAAYGIEVRVLPMPEIGRPVCAPELPAVT